MTKQRPIRVDRYGYIKGNSSFEQTLDVWKPVVLDDEEEESTCISSESPPLPVVVVLVVGSAWLGHRSIIYSGTSWWNASGPKTFAQLGYVCVCVRHRGAFPSPPDPWLIGLPLLVLISAFAAASSSIVMGLQVAAMLICLWTLWAFGRKGSANFEDMLEDVSEALKWVHANKDLIALNDGCGTKNGKEYKPPLLVFGGYSSGGHVAASLLQRPDLLQSKGLPTPDNGLCDAVLFLSGVLATRPQDDDSPLSSPPCWFTDLLLITVFGSREAVAKVPSPFHGTKPPNLPHLFIGCQKEVFGIPLLDTFFCSREFALILQQAGVPARFVGIDSNHWWILSSRALSNAISKEMHWIYYNKGKTKGDVPPHSTKHGEQTERPQSYGFTAPAVRRVSTTSSSDSNSRQVITK